MDRMTGGYTTIDEYIALQPAEEQAILQKVRLTIHKLAPDATEKISYGMPTFYLFGNLVHFASQKNHYGFYPTGSGVEAFEADLGAYQHTKGAIQFPKDQPVPYDLVRRIVSFRVKENLEREAARQAKKKK